MSSQTSSNYSASKIPKDNHALKDLHNLQKPDNEELFNYNEKDKTPSKNT